MNGNAVWWMLIILGLIFICRFAVNFWRGFVDGYNGVPEVEDYRADKLLLKIYYDRAVRSAVADLADWEHDGVVRVLVFVSRPPMNEVERQSEGKWADAGPAIVKIRKGTNEVVAWQYIK